MPTPVHLSLLNHVIASQDSGHVSLYPVALFFRCVELKLQLKYSTSQDILSQSFQYGGGAAISAHVTQLS